MSGPSPAATAAVARGAFRENVEAKGHAVDNIRAGVSDLRAAIDRGDVHTTPAIEQMLEDLHAALQQDEGQRLGGKSAEAARFIARALLRELDRQVPDV